MQLEVSRSIVVTSEQLERGDCHPFARRWRYITRDFLTARNPKSHPTDGVKQTLKRVVTHPINAQQTVKLRPQFLRMVEPLALEKLGEKNEIYLNGGSSNGRGDSKRLKENEQHLTNKTLRKQPSLRCAKQANKGGEATDSLHTTQGTE